MNDDNKSYTYDTIVEDYEENESTGLDKKIKYPEISCLQLELNFLTLFIPIIVFLVFIIVPTGILYSVFFAGEKSTDYALILGVFPFYLVALIALYSTVKIFENYFLLHKNGKTIKGVIYNYSMDKDYSKGGRKGILVYIKINTPEGDRTIKYRVLGKKPVKVNTEVELLNYNDYYKLLV